MTHLATKFDALSREVALCCLPDGTVTYADTRARQRLGIVEGERLQRLCPSGMEAKLEALLRRAASGEVVSGEVALLTKGKVVTFMFDAARDPDSDAVILVGAILPASYSHAFAQVSETVVELGELQRRSERQRQELEQQNHELRRLTTELVDSNSGVVALQSELTQKAGEIVRQGQVNDRLLSSVSHEFRTPLHSILGLTQLLVDGADGNLTDEQEKQVRFIRSSAEELIQLVNDMLDLSKVEAGQSSLRAERFSLSDFLVSQRGALRPLLPAGGGVELVFEEAPDDVFLETDRAKLSQIVRNLVSNAIKFTDEGEVRVRASVVGGKLSLTVADTGIGIAPAFQERVFEEFGQVDAAQHNRPKGTGLGLPIARGLANFLGGDITLTSTLGLGSTFTLTLPLVHDEVREMGNLRARNTVLDPDRAPVLVVEDDRKTIFVYERYLTMAGFQALPARTVEEARAQLSRVTPAAVVLDIMLEGESSWDFLAELKRNPQTADVPVLVVTVTNREKKARALGADEFWFKPLDPDRLLKKLKSLARPARPSRVLFIDDDEKARYLIQKHLDGTPYACITASTGEEGVRLAQEQHPDIILLDFLLEKSTAFDVLDELKADPRTRPIPVIIVTSHLLDEVARARLLEEADSVISKQHLSRELALNRIRDALRKAGLGSMPPL